MGFAARAAAVAVVGTLVGTPAETTAWAQAPQSSASATPTSRAQPAPMSTRTTGDLVALCNTPDTDPSYPSAIGVCVGYGSGVLDYHRADAYRNRRALKVCVPQPPPTRGAARTAFIAWAQAHPQYMGDPAVEGVMRFLIATYPCGR